MGTPWYARGMAKTLACNTCGSTNVEWRQSKAGKWYLAELNDGIRGSVFSSGPHHNVCARKQATAAHNAEVAAREAKMQELFAAGDIEALKAYYEEQAK